MSKSADCSCMYKPSTHHTYPVMDRLWGWIHNGNMSGSECVTNKLLHIPGSMHTSGLNKPLLLHYVWTNAWCIQDVRLYHHTRNPSSLTPTHSNLLWLTLMLFALWLPHEYCALCISWNGNPLCKQHVLHRADLHVSHIRLAVKTARINSLCTVLCIE